MTMKLFFMMITIALFAPTLSAQRAVEGCEAKMAYENRNQVEYDPLPIQSVSGIALDKDGVSIPGVCLGLFTERKHRLIERTVTDQKGNFKFRRLPSGRYRLVAKYSGFCPANTSLLVKRDSSNKILRRKRLVLHMEFVGIDRCSYIR